MKYFRVNTDNRFITENLNESGVWLVYLAILSQFHRLRNVEWKGSLEYRIIEPEVESCRFPNQILSYHSSGRTTIKTDHELFTFEIRFETRAQ